MTIEYKYNIGQKVWFIVKPINGLPDFKPKMDQCEILDIEFSEDTDIVYVFSKYRCCCRHKYLEGECFPTKEALIESL